MSLSDIRKVFCFPNQGHTCYANASLQALSPLLQILWQTMSIDLPPDSMAERLRKAYMEKHSTDDISDIVKNMDSDAVEFVEMILQRLQSEIPMYADVFTTYYSCEALCPICSKVNKVQGSTTTLNIPNLDKTDINECIESALNSLFGNALDKLPFCSCGSVCYLPYWHYPLLHLLLILFSLLLYLPERICYCS